MYKDAEIARLKQAIHDIILKSHEHLLAIAQDADEAEDARSRLAVVADALAVENELLEDEVLRLRDSGRLCASEVLSILDGNAAFLDKRHAELDAEEARADRLEAALRELVEAVEWRDECYDVAEMWGAGGLPVLLYEAQAEVGESIVAAEKNIRSALTAAREVLPDKCQQHGVPCYDKAGNLLWVDCNHPENKDCYWNHNGECLADDGCCGEESA